MSRNHRSHYFGAEAKARIEIIPMIDVMMFLLVFFVLIMTEMIQNAGVQLDLPQSSTAKPLPNSKISLSVDRGGLLYMDGQATSAAQVSNRLRMAVQTGKVDLIVSGDEATPYQNIVRVMDLARAAGVTSIGLAARTL